MIDRMATLRNGFRVTRACGPDGLYELSIKFRSLEDLDAADQELRAAFDREEIDGKPLTGADLAAPGARAAERIQFLTQPTTVQQEPDPLLIDSMCMRWRHDFGLQRDADDQLSSGFTDAERDSLRSSMRQLWEEVVGRGFYRPAARKGVQPVERGEGAE